MLKSTKFAITAGLLVLVAACSQQAETEEFVVIEPAPMSVEPVFTGKYK